MYKITGTVKVTAQSSIHDSRAEWDKLTGEAHIDLDALDAAMATFSVDMTSFDAGDWLKNRKIRSDLEVDRNPLAKFELTGLTNLVRTGNRFEAMAIGSLRWRGVEAPLEAASSGTVESQRLTAAATFSLDVTRFGITPPKILMFKVADVVEVHVVVTGVAC